MSPKFCWVVALHAEAAPIIDAFELKMSSNELLFPVYINPDNGHCLVVSGVGAVRSASAATFLKVQLSVGKYAAWINIGVAGYFEDKLGSVYQAIKVMGQSIGDTFSPGLRFSGIFKSATLITVSRPEKKFSEQALYDMEASGFCSICPRFSCNELTYVIKIVSDTPNSSYKLLTRKSLTKLIENQMSVIIEFSYQLSNIVESERIRLDCPIEVSEFESAFKFSKTRKLMFRNAYRKWKVIFPDKALKASDFQGSSPKEIIEHINTQILIAADNWRIT